MISKAHLRVLVFLVCSTGALFAQEYDFRVFGNAEGLNNLAVRAKNGGVYWLPAGHAQFRRPDTTISGSAMGRVLAIDTDGRILLPSPDRLLIRDQKSWQKIDLLLSATGGVADHCVQEA